MPNALRTDPYEKNYFIRLLPWVKRPLARRAAIMREAKEVERFRLVQTTTSTSFRRIAAKLQQACLVWVQFQAELLKSPPKLLEAALGVGTVLEPKNEVIRVGEPS